MNLPTNENDTLINDGAYFMRFGRSVKNAFQLNHRTYAFRGWGIFTLIMIFLLISLASAANFDSVFAWGVGLLYVTYDTWLIVYVAWKTRKLRAAQQITKTKVTSAPPSKVIKELKIGVLVPVHNESDVVIATIEKLIEQTDAPKQIIIVNDGSTDDSVQKLAQYYDFSRQQVLSNNVLIQSHLYEHIWILNKENSGKADSMNQALEYLACDVVVTVDADTLLEPDAIKEIRLTFCNNANLAAACGILKPVTKGNIFARIFGVLQYFEYLRAFLSRAAWTQSNALLLVSGAFSAYRKKALVAVGGYDASSLVEDYELIHRMHKYSCDKGLGWTVGIVEKARATTDAPTTISAFIQQRKRWFAGFLRTQFKYREMIGAAQYNDVGRFMMPIKTVDTLQPIFGLTALYLLIMFAFTDAHIAGYILIVIGVKLCIDYSFHMWALFKYHLWLGKKLPPNRWWQATACCLVDPFFFQPLRHISALVGWSIVLKANVRWEPIRIHTNNQ